MADLKIKHEKFCQEYVLNGGNVTQAMIAAGYSSAYAHARGHEMLENVGILERIEEIRGESETEVGVTRNQVIAEHAKMAFLNPQVMFDVDGNMLSIKDMPPEAAAAIAGFEVMQRVVKTIDGDGEEETQVISQVMTKVKFASKQPSLQELAKILGYYAPEVKDIKIKIDNLSSLSDAELAELAKG